MQDGKLRMASESSRHLYRRTSGGARPPLEGACVDCGAMGDGNKKKLKQVSSANISEHSPQPTLVHRPSSPCLRPRERKPLQVYTETEVHRRHFLPPWARFVCILKSQKVVGFLFLILFCLSTNLVKNSS